MADYEAKQGDTAPAWTDTLTYSDGTAANLTGASVSFVMRARSQNAPVTNATATIVNPTAGTVSYTPTAADTAIAGLYTANWVVTFSGPTVIQTWPTDGYLTVEIQENLLTVNQTIVELDDVKDFLNIRSSDRSHDGELLRFIAGCGPVVEFIVGPVLPRVFQNELYDGGSSFLSLRHRPVISVSEVIEYRGPVPWLLEQVPSADQGTIYSYEFEPPGRIVRRNVGGGTQTFPGGMETVRVTYTAGYQTIPQNIRLGMLELVRVNYQETQQAGGGRIGSAFSPPDVDIPAAQAMGYLVPGRVRELLAPSKRHPAVA